MNKNGLGEFPAIEAISDPLAELLRTGTKRLIQQAIKAEPAELSARYEGWVDEQGFRVVVHNSFLPKWEILTGVDPVAEKVPKVRSRTNKPVVFRSSLELPYECKARWVEAA